MPINMKKSAARSRPTKTGKRKQKIFIVGQNMDEGVQIFGAFTAIRRAENVLLKHIKGQPKEQQDKFWVEHVVLNEEDFVAREM